MLWKSAAFAAAMVLLSAIAAERVEAASTTSPASVVISRALVSESSFSSSPCNGNAYAGQCASGNCSCIYMSGEYCKARIGSKPNKSKQCVLSIAIDLGLATNHGLPVGTSGCSPMFGVLRGYGSGDTVATEFFLNGTYCPTKGVNLSGGWVLDSATSYSQGQGLLTGSMGGSLSLTLKGQMAPK
jgi:hypothetical protein